MTNHDELCEKDKEIKELRTRVAEANKIIEAKHDYCSSLCCDIANLQDRLSQAEEKEKELRENWLEDMQEWSVEKATLLKASEGIEKALEESNELASLYAYDFRARLQHPRNQAEIDGNFETVEKAKQALAEWKKVSKENG